MEGKVESGQSVVVIEDLISTGGSSLKAVNALRATGAHVLGMTSIFTYGFKIADENFKNENCKLINLSDYDTLIHQALASGFINEKDFETIKNWRLDPGNWKPNL